MARPLLVDLEGKTFGRLMVLKRSESMPQKYALWDCVCSCGNKAIVSGGSLRSGDSKSCGCLQRERTSITHLTHGETAHHQTTPEYRSWCSIKKHCGDPKNIGYKYYGGRGIKVCAQWMNSFENFLADMGRKPSPQHTIDRIDNNGDYEPGNCRWATAKQQVENRGR